MGGVRPKLATLRSAVQSLPRTLATINPNSWRNDKTSTQRGYGYRWQQARARYLSDNPLCAYCDQTGRTTTANVVDHKVPHHGDQKLFWDETNWQPLCKPCHDTVKAREEGRRLARHSIGSDGWPVSR